MPQATKEIKGRIRSITNTKKITKTMELVSAAKMRRAVEAVTHSNAYADRAWEVVINLAKKADRTLHPLLVEKEEIKKVAVVLVSSNRGLCGGFNTNVTKTCLDYLDGLSSDIEVEIVTLGAKGARSLHKGGHNVVADFPKADLTSSLEDIMTLTRTLIDGYQEHKYDQVVLIYTDFESSLKQVPRVKKLLPIEPQPDEYLGVVNDNKEELEENWQKDEYIFEPNTKDVLEFILPRLIEAQIYQAVLESDASEHSARMFAMRNATDNAGGMIKDLTFAFNQARQSGITQEIAEISAGRAALE